MRSFARCTLALILAGIVRSAATQAQERDWSKIEITTTHVAGSVYMLAGAGGNIGVSAGDDGVFLIDDQFAPLSDKVKAAVAAISAKPIRFLINTHWHGDHTGGNENFGKAGVVIVAQDNVRTRMTVEQVNELWKRVTPPAPAAALPILTFTDGITLHLNGDTARVIHVPPAHTDGDSYIVFESANVVHTGDLFFNGGYPVIDVSAGGGISGMIAAADRLLQAVRPDARLIPGHGALGTPADLSAFRDMLQTAREHVAVLVKAGKTIDETVAAKPTAAFDARWGQFLVDPGYFTRLVYEGV
jgi:glyoxylase-like metal-dependent hydrolase (beta-lactamase superfamily II)